VSKPEVVLLATRWKASAGSYSTLKREVYGCLVEAFFLSFTFLMIFFFTKVVVLVSG
jgi:hypothetical protein